MITFPTLTEDEDDSTEVMNRWLHGLLGFHTEEERSTAWSSIPPPKFQVALQAIQIFHSKFTSNIVVDLWLKKIHNFLGIGSSTMASASACAPSVPPGDPPLVPSQPPPAKATPAWLRYRHSAGGSSSSKPMRNTKKKSPQEKKDDDLVRATAKMGGSSNVAELQASWAALDQRYGGIEFEQGEGVLIGLLLNQFSAREIRSMLPVGGYKIDRLKRGIDTDFVDFRTKRPKQLGSHRVTDDEKSFLMADVATWEIEDGFPCAHRRPRTYLVEEKLTWVMLHSRYEVKARNAGVRLISYSRWLQDMHNYYPGMRLSRSKEDVCDACTRIDTQLLCPDISQELKAKLTLERAMHIEAAVDQRRAMSHFVKKFVTQVDPKQILPSEILDDCIDTGLEASLEKKNHDELDLNAIPVPTVLIQCEDSGGSLALPHYGFRRPSVDYFNSNLSLHNFVTANINDNTNRVSFYDERGQGKGADALCSLRLVNYLRVLDGYRARGGEIPSFLINILDNCVGQNKSNVVIKFFAMVFLLMFEKVVLLYLIPGHSHMKADRVVAWFKGAIHGKNHYSPIDIAQACSKVKGIDAEFLDHRDPHRSFFTDWEVILDKYFSKMPVGFTANYFFEFDEEIVTMRHLATSPESDKVCVPLILPGSAQSIRSALLMDLFGHASITELTLDSVKKLKLPRHPGNPVTRKKIKSMSKKYISIPSEHLHYYPVLGEGGGDDSEEEEEAECVETQSTVTKKKFVRIEKDAVGARKPGRPKKQPPSLANQKSILGFFAGGFPSMRN